MYLLTIFRVSVPFLAQWNKVSIAVFPTGERSTRANMTFVGIFKWDQELLLDTEGETTGNSKNVFREMPARPFSNEWKEFLVHFQCWNGTRGKCVARVEEHCGKSSAFPHRIANTEVWGTLPLEEHAWPRFRAAHPVIDILTPPSVLMRLLVRSYRHEF